MIKKAKKRHPSIKTYRNKNNWQTKIQVYKSEIEKYKWKELKNTRGKHREWKLSIFIYVQKYKNRES